MSMKEKLTPELFQELLKTVEVAPEVSAQPKPETPHL